MVMVELFIYKVMQQSQIVILMTTPLQHHLGQFM
jgi:hypothetical protein